MLRSLTFFLYILLLLYIEGLFLLFLCVSPVNSVRSDVISVADYQRKWTEKLFLPVLRVIFLLLVVIFYMEDKPSRMCCCWPFGGIHRNSFLHTIAAVCVSR